MTNAAFRCFFPGRVRLFGKTNGHSRESRATNAAGKNALSQRRNKAERNCRHTQGTQQIKKQKLPHRIFVRQLLLFGFDMYPQYWVSSIGGTYHFCLFLSLYSEQHFRCFQFV